MLVLAVDEGEYIMIGEDIKVKLLSRGKEYRIGIDAPKSVAIRRQAVYERMTGVAPERSSKAVAAAAGV